MEQGYLAQVQALIDQKWKENPEEMKRVMGEIKAKEKQKAKVKTQKRVSFDLQLLTQELIKELNKEDWVSVDVSKIKDLIERGADVDAKADDGATPLHFASWKNSIEIAKLLLDRGANVNVENDCGETPLHLASDNSIEIAKLLLDAGANVRAITNYGETPLDWADDKMKAILKKYMK